MPPRITDQAMAAFMVSLPWMSMMSHPTQAVICGAMIHFGISERAAARLYGRVTERGLVQRQWEDRWSKTHRDGALSPGGWLALTRYQRWTYPDSQPGQVDAETP